MKMISRLEWTSPEDVAKKARKAGRRPKQSDFMAVLERTLANESWIAIGTVFDAFVKEAAKGPVHPDAGGGILKRMEKALKLGYPWLGDLLLLSVGKLDPESKAILGELGVANPAKYRDQYVEAGSCALAVFENARYQMTKLSGTVFIDEKALIRYQAKMDALYERAFKASDGLVRLQPEPPGTFRKKAPRGKKRKR